MSEEALVTISCTAYNHEKFIRDALNGFVKQKANFKFKVIVHDDASTDATPAIIREYELKYPHIFYPIYQTENQWSKGVRPSQTFIWPRITSKYVALCEGDDYWTDEFKLQKQVDFLEKHPEYVLCYHDWQVLNGETNQLSVKIQKGYRTLTLVFRNVLAGFEIPKFIRNGDTLLKFYLSTKGKFKYLEGIRPAIHRHTLQGIWSMQAADFKLKEKTRTLEYIWSNYANTPYRKRAARLLAGQVYNNRKFLFNGLNASFAKWKYVWDKQILFAYLSIVLKNTMLKVYRLLTN